jgi:hypothetical protein
MRSVLSAPSMLDVLAGQPGGQGTADGTGSGARFQSPRGVAADGAGKLFVADYCTIRQVIIATGEVTTLGGNPDSCGSDDSTDGTGKTARFYQPKGMVADGAGNLFVSEAGNSMIRKIVIATGETTTLAGAAQAFGSDDSTDGTGRTARFDTPRGLALDGAGNLYVADTRNHTIRKVVIATGATTTLAGVAGQLGSSDGTGQSARFHSPQGLVFDGAGNLFVADTKNDTIRKLVIATGATTTLAGVAGQAGSGDGTGQSARFDTPTGVTVDGAGNFYVADDGNGTIRKVVIGTGAVTTLAGVAGQSGSSDSTDGTGQTARFNSLASIAQDAAGDLFVADMANFTIRKVVAATGAVSTLAGATGKEGHDDSTDGTGATASFKQPAGIVLDGAGNLFVADCYNHIIRKVVVATGAVTTLAGVAGQAGNRDSTDGTGTTAQFNYPWGLATDGAGNLFVSDQDNHLIRKIVIATGATTTLAGNGQFCTSGDSTDGTGKTAGFCYPSGLVTAGAGNLFVVDMLHDTIRKVVIATGETTTLAGVDSKPGASDSTDGTGKTALFGNPTGITTDGAGNLYVADFRNYTVRKVVIATGATSTVAGLAGVSGASDSTDGTGQTARFSGVQDIAYDGSGNLLVSDYDNHTIRKVVISTGAVSTLVGSPGSAGVGPGLLPASLNGPKGLAVALDGSFFITDWIEDAVLRVHSF